MGRAITEEGMFELAKSLLAQVVVDGRAWPCANLSLSVGGFEEGVQGNQGIGSFLVRGDDAKALQNAQPKAEATPPPAKRRRVDGNGIAKFFGSAREESRESSGGVSDFEHRQETPQHIDVQEEEIAAEAPAHGPTESEPNDEYDPLLPPPSAQVADISTKEVTTSRPIPSLEPNAPFEAYSCPRCSAQMPFNEQAEHNDFHFAQDLQNEQTTPPRAPPPKPTPSTAKPSASSSLRGGGSTRGRGRGRPGPMSGGPEKGQKKLHF